jgi:hypothetical protein
MLERLIPRVFARRAQALAKDLVREYGRVLTPQELRQYFGEEEVIAPGLPDDRSV